MLFMNNFALPQRLNTRSSKTNFIYNPHCHANLLLFIIYFYITRYKKIVPVLLFKNIYIYVNIESCYFSRSAPEFLTIYVPTYII